MFFRDLIGHGEKLSELRRALVQGRLPHALLFCGRPGVGKSLAARALLAAKLCEQGGDEACGSCPSCRAFCGGNHPDVETVARIEGKRDVGIAQVRGLLEFLHRTGHGESGKAAIVDDAERMTFEAQNAFLKTLEEPPAGTLLVLVTANLQRLLPTVRSRCATHRFGPLSDAEMAEFARRRGTDAAVPAALGLGSPGRWLELCHADLQDALAVTHGLVVQPSRTSPFDFAADLTARVTVDDDEDDDARERKRDRLRTSIRLLAAELRDLQVVALGLQAPLVHRHREADLRAAAAGVDPDRAADGIDACERAVADLGANLDPVLVLERLAMEVRDLLAPGGSGVQSAARRADKHA